MEVFFPLEAIVAVSLTFGGSHTLQHYDLFAAYGIGWTLSFFHMSCLELPCTCEKKHSLCWCQNATCCCRNLGTASVWIFQEGWGGGFQFRSAYFVNPSHFPVIASPCLLRGENSYTAQNRKDNFFTAMSEIIYSPWVVLGTRSAGGGREHQAWLYPSDHCAVLGTCLVLMVVVLVYFQNKGKLSCGKVNNLLRVIWLIKARWIVKFSPSGFQSLFTHPYRQTGLLLKNATPRNENMWQIWKAINSSLNKSIRCFMKLLAVGVFQNINFP